MYVFARLCLESRYLERNSVGRNIILVKKLVIFRFISMQCKMSKTIRKYFDGYMFVKAQTFKMLDVFFFIPCFSTMFQSIGLCNRNDGNEYWTNPRLFQLVYSTFVLCIMFIVIFITILIFIVIHYIEIIRIIYPIQL